MTDLVYITDGRRILHVLEAAFDEAYAPKGYRKTEPPASRLNELLESGRAPMVSVSGERTTGTPALTSTGRYRRDN